VPRLYNFVLPAASLSWASLSWLQTWLRSRPSGAIH
jgi:hypothetical protein